MNDFFGQTFLDQFLYVTPFAVPISFFVRVDDKGTVASSVTLVPVIIKLYQIIRFRLFSFIGKS